MIERYQAPEIAQWFEDQQRFRLWADVEMAALHQQAFAQIVPSHDVQKIQHRLDQVNWRDVPGAVALAELTTRHDVAAFVQVMGELLGPEANRWWHFGLTSSDVVDTATALALWPASNAVLHEAFSVRRHLMRKLLDWTGVQTIGRTHGQHAIVMPLAHRAEVWEETLQRAIDRFERAQFAIRVGKLSGPVGCNSPYLPAEVEQLALRDLGLEMVASTQVVPRDLHIDWVYGLVSITNAIEQIALDIRLLAQSEIQELFEPRSTGQMGSSSMPHKTNPIQCEKICGLARLMRGYLQSMLESQALWNERDISHSSVERVVLPDAAATAHHICKSMAQVLASLQQRPAQYITEQSTFAATSEAVASGTDRAAAWQQNAS